ncbi:MAG TPA: hypothetical protein ENK58_08070 [Desulfobacterales bacterium]|nr:hypothetical protein [Desulfobacterales bacterium]
MKKEIVSRTGRLDKPARWEIIVVTGIILILSLITGMCLMPSDRCNCVVVSDESQYIGRYLKHSGPDSRRTTVLKTTCKRMDQEIDGGDGPEKGRVRWADCKMGPDCEETGMF